MARQESLPLGLPPKEAAQYECVTIGIVCLMVVRLLRIEKSSVVREMND
jgi:hypothetical protein